MSLLEAVYSLALLGLGFFLGWGLHCIKMDDEISENRDLVEKFNRCKNRLEYAEYEISTLRRENHKLQIRVSVLKSDITALRTENVAHVQRHKGSPEVKEAVKYAMKSAHPDNGGDAKDFMKFRELYNKIK
jgi:predicted nuclease with TOPRIM domain